MLKVDYIIVGQGLAGSAVAVQLMRRERKVLVIDQSHENTSSRIAAGLFNPVTGKKNVRTWMAETLFSYLHDYYTAAEALTGRQFYHPKGIYRPFLSVEEQNEWMARTADPSYTYVIDNVFVKNSFEHVHDPLGGLLLKNCGYINTKEYIDGVRQWLRSQDSLRDEYFDEAELHVLPDGVEYRGVRAAYIIFCQGVQALQSGLFQGLPLRPLKGETLTIKSDFRKDVILNRGVYMVPDGVSGHFRVGATYKLRDLAPGVSEEGRQELETKLDEILNTAFEVVGSDWGLRPTTTDRRPLLGAHPKHERLIIFNGLGTKGVSLAPYFSNVLICWLENSGVLPDEVTLNRYK